MTSNTIPLFACFSCQRSHEYRAHDSKPRVMYGEIPEQPLLINGMHWFAILTLSTSRWALIMMKPWGGSGLRQHPQSWHTAQCTLSVIMHTKTLSLWHLLFIMWPPLVWDLMKTLSSPFDNWLQALLKFSHPLFLHRGRWLDSHSGI